MMTYNTHRHCVWKAAEVLFDGDTDACSLATKIYDSAPGQIEKIGVLVEYLKKLEEFDTEKSRKMISYIRSTANL